MEQENKEDPFEFQILALALRQPGAITRFAADLNPKDVGLIHGQPGIYELYRAILSFYDNTGLDPIDPIAFRSWLRTETDIYDALGGDHGIDGLLAKLEIVELTTIDAAVQMTQYRAKKRAQLDKVQELHKIISNKGINNPEDVERLRAVTEEIKDLEKDLKYDPLANVTTALDIVDRISDLWDIPPFLKTQFPSLNRALGYTEDGGFFRGGVHSIIAMSGFGKSTLCKCLCNHWLDEGYTVLFINFEEAQSHWERILMTQITGTNVYAYANVLDEISKDGLTKKFSKRLKQWGKRLLVRHDPDSLFFEDLDKWLRDVINNTDVRPDVVVIDTIQSMFIKTGGKARWGEFEQIMVRLEKLAKDMDAVFIITSQQNMNATKEKREVINQADTGGSVTIIQKSTVALFLTQQKMAEDDDSIDESLMQVQIPKNRITGTAFSNNPPVIKYIDEIKSYVPFDIQEDVRYMEDYIEKELVEGNTY